MFELVMESFCDLEWTIGKRLRAKFSGKSVGYVELYELEKDLIDTCIEEDCAFYMFEDTHINENLCNFIYESIGSNKVVFINELFIDKEYRNKGIGSNVLKYIEELYPGYAFMLFAGDIEQPFNFVENEKYRISVIKKLHNFYNKNSFKNYKQVYFKNIEFKESDWTKYDEYKPY